MFRCRPVSALRHPASDRDSEYQAKFTEVQNLLDGPQSSPYTRPLMDRGKSLVGYWHHHHRRPAVRSGRKGRGAASNYSPQKILSTAHFWCNTNYVNLTAALDWDDASAPGAAMPHGNSLLGARHRRL